MIGKRRNLIYKRKVMSFHVKGLRKIIVRNAGRKNKNN